MSAWTLLLAFALFGLWTVACVMVGAWLGHRRSLGLNPAPDLEAMLAAMKQEPQPGPEIAPDEAPARFNGWRLGNRPPLGFREAEPASKE